MANRLYNKQVSPKGYKAGGRVNKMGGGMMKRPMYKTGGKVMGSRTGFDAGQLAEARKVDKEGYKHKGKLKKLYKEIVGRDRKLNRPEDALMALTRADVGVKFVKGLEKKGINADKLKEDILKEKMKSKEFRIGKDKPGTTIDRGYGKEDKYRIYKMGGRVKKMGGGSLKAVPAGNKGLKKLPTKVRNKMGFMKKGGKVK